MEFKVETHTVDTDTPAIIGVRAVVNGQIVGPSLLCHPDAYNAFSSRMQDLIRNVSDRAYAKGQHDAKMAIRTAIGALG